MLPLGEPGWMCFGGALVVFGGPDGVVTLFGGAV